MLNPRITEAIATERIEEMRTEAAHRRTVRQAVASRRAHGAVASFLAPSERLARTEEVVWAAEKLTARASASGPATAGAEEQALSSAGKC